MDHNEMKPSEIMNDDQWTVPWKDGPEWKISEWKEDAPMDWIGDELGVWNMFSEVDILSREEAPRKHPGRELKQR